MQNREMKTVPRKILMYFGAIPLTSMVGWSMISKQTCNVRVEPHHAPFENGKDLYIHYLSGSFPTEVESVHVPSSNLVPDSSEYEACSGEELCGPTVEFADYGGHIPFYVAPDLGVCAGDEDWG